MKSVVLLRVVARAMLPFVWLVIICRAMAHCSRAERIFEDAKISHDASPLLFVEVEAAGLQVVELSA